MSKYLFITSVSSNTICPPYFVLDDPALNGQNPDGLDPLRHVQGADFSVDIINNEEALGFLGLASPYLTPKNNYTKIIASFMMMFPDSILYLVDGYPEPLLEAHCRLFITMINQLRETPEDHPQHHDTWKYHKIEAGKTDDVSNWVEKMQTYLPRTEPHVFYEHVKDYPILKVRMDNARLWGEANEYIVKNFHADTLETMFPFAFEYIRAVQEYNKRLQSGQVQSPPRPRIQLAPDTPPIGNS